MKIKEAVYEEIMIKSKQLVTPEVFGCDACKSELLNHPNENTRLEVNVFYHNGESESIHFCSWKCVFNHLPKIKSDYFLSLPYVHFDTTGKRSAEELIELLKDKKNGKK